MTMPEGPVVTFPVHQHPQMHSHTQDTPGFPQENQKKFQGEVKCQSLQEVLKQDQGQWEVKGQGKEDIHPIDQSIDSLGPMSTPAPLGQPGDSGPSMIGHHPATTIRALEDFLLCTNIPACCDLKPTETGPSLDQEDINQVLSVSTDTELELWTRTMNSQVFRPASGQVSLVNKLAPGQDILVNKPAPDDDIQVNRPFPGQDLQVCRPAPGQASGVGENPGLQPPYDRRQESRCPNEASSPSYPCAVSSSSGASSPSSISLSPLLCPGRTRGLVALEESFIDLLRIVKHKPSAIVFSGEENVSPTTANMPQSSDGEDASLADAEDGDDVEADDDEDEGEVPELPQYKEFLVSRQRRNLSRNRKSLRKGLDVQPIGSQIGRGSTHKAEPVTKVAEEDEEEIERMKARSRSCKSMCQLMRKLDELNLDIKEAFNAGSSSHSDTPPDNDNSPKMILQQDLQVSASVPEMMMNEDDARLSDRPPESTVSSTRRRSRPLARSRPLTRSSLHSTSHIHLRHGRAGIKMTSASAEIEAKEACDWLRAAGFPQYAQLYEDSLFPIDIPSVKRDHDFLDRDLVEPLCRRLNTLNKCCSLKLDNSHPRKKTDDSDEDDPLAISKRWTFECNSRRWSRLQDIHFLLDSPNESSPDGCQGEGLLRTTASTESVLTDLSEPEITDVSSLHSQDSLGAMLPDSFSMASLAGPYQPPSDMSHYNSLPIKSSRNSQGGRSPAKAILRRMELIRTWGPSSRRKSGSRRAPLVIGEPILQGEALQTLQCVPITQSECSPNTLHQSCESTSPTSQEIEGQSELSCVSSVSPSVKDMVSKPRPKRGSVYLEDMELRSGSPHSRKNEVQQGPFSRNHFRSYEDLLVHIPKDHKPGTFPKALSIESLAPTTDYRHQSSSPYPLLPSQGSPFSVIPLSKKPPCPGAPRGSRVSVYDNIPGSHLYASTGDLLDMEQDTILFPHLDDIITHVSGLQQIVDHWSRGVLPEGEAREASEETGGEEKGEAEGRTTPTRGEADGVSMNDTDSTEARRERRDSGVGASLTRPRLRWPSFHLSDQLSQSGSSLCISSQSAGQLSLLQKFSLLRLTAIMEKYSMSNKHGWTWSVPKFMKRMKVPDYKDRSVFGVPLIVHTQRCGYPLPLCVQQALRHLRTRCLDQVGLFRKSGVKSRIQALRQECETSPDRVDYEDQSAYDVADMIKQFFRDLPEPLLTSKLGDTFLHIYQYVPNEQRLQAVRAAILLMSDENREVLQSLLCFLCDVTSCVEENQMTPMNLAVCLGPSLFHLNILKSDNLSPRSIQKKYTTGRPDQKDLSENLAATQGLAHMITECQRLFEIPEEMVSQSRNTYMEAELLAPPLDELCKSHDDAMEEEEEEDEGLYHAHVESLVQNLLKEARDRTKAWVSRPSMDHIELACKKVGDGNPLRRWRVCVEVCAPPSEVLDRLLMQRPLWQTGILQEKVLETPDRQTDIYQYSLRSMPPHPNTDYVVLRSWRSDVSKGCSVLVCASVDHEDSAAMATVRGVVLESQYLLEPCGTGRSKMTHICRVDLKGRSPDWYNKTFGHLCVSEAQRIRSSFHPPDTPGPESKI